MAYFTHDGDRQALDYGRLEQPWRDWARIARSFAYQMDDQWDREDLMHNIIVRLAEVAKVYRERDMPFHRGAWIKVAQYTRLCFYHQKKRWKRVASVSLNRIVREGDSSETELVNTLVARKEVDLDAWIDAESHYQGSPERVKRAVRKLLNENWRTLSGWKLVRWFRTEFKAKMRLR